MSRISGFVFASALIVLAALPASAQVATGTPPFGSFSGGPDVINLGNLNGHWTIPILHKPGRGGFNFDYDLGYDTSVWYPLTINGQQAWQPVGSWGWTGQAQGISGSVSYTSSYSSTQQYCGPDQGYLTIVTWTYANWRYYDPYGAVHAYTSTSSTTPYTGCGQNWSQNSSFGETASDGPVTALPPPALVRPAA